jgi:phosphopantothenoylcysteine synthetase/decarboxylase
MKDIDLSGKSILVTAGSTWIPIDTVRVITNIFKGKIGVTIAESASLAGAKVTLLLGPSFDASSLTPLPNLEVIRFKFFDDLDRLITKCLSGEKFDAVIHSAAVSDFRLSDVKSGKIKSNVDELILKLVPTKKLVDYIKKLNPETFLVKFKLEVDISDSDLQKVALKSLKESSADLVVANIYNPKFTDHEAYIIDSGGKSVKAVGRNVIAETILRKIYERA